MSSIQLQFLYFDPNNINKLYVTNTSSKVNDLNSVTNILFSPLIVPTPAVIATSFYTISYITVTSQCFLHHRRIVISRSWFEMSHVNVVHRLAFQPIFNLITNHYFTYINAFTLVHLSVFELASIYIWR